MVAKLASEAAKPSGVAHRADPRRRRPGGGAPVTSRASCGRCRPGPCGAGPATKLERLGVRTVGDIADLPEAALVGALGTVNGRHLGLLARGVDPLPVEPDQRLRSIGHEETFAHDHEPATLAREAARWPTPWPGGCGVRPGGPDGHDQGALR